LVLVAKITFFPVANGDTSQIVLGNGRWLLFDFHHQKKCEEEGSTDFNLRKHLKGQLKGAQRDYYDVLALTHGDDDHIRNSTEFFELRHAAKYQGGDRTKVSELWVPAAMILEEGTNDQQSNEVIIWRQEARHRLKEGKGIRVFSRPDKLKAWLEENGLTLDQRRHLITDAGELVPGFTLANDEVEFFCHSPFIKHTDEGDVLRNEASLIFQVRFEIGGTRFNYWAVGDSTHEVLADIVQISKYHGNHDRLDWDLYNIPHHCSYLALGPEKGAERTAPTDAVAELLRHGQRGAYIVSSSNPIGNDRAAYEQQQPPHVQARNTYLDYLNEVGGRRFLVTMEEPNAVRPQPIVFEISSTGGKLVLARTGSAAIVSSPAPRAG
jgi:hypothetical protein